MSRLSAPTLIACLTLALTLASCASNAPQASADPQAGNAALEDYPDSGGPNFTPARAAAQHITGIAPDIDRSRLPTNARLQQATIARGPTLSAQALPLNAQVNKVRMKILVVSSGTGDYGIDSAKSMLQESGVPYDVLDASSTPLSITTLVGADGIGNYQGVILTSSHLLLPPQDGLYYSALDSSEWATLFEYEKAYKARQLVLYGAPEVSPEDYGLRIDYSSATSTTTLVPNAAGLGVFNDLNNTTIPVNYAYTYPTTLEPVAGVTTQPLLTDPAGHILAATSTVDGRERLILTTAQNPYLMHTQLLSYGLVKWVTRGVHLGEHRRFLQVDIDDWFLEGDRLNPATLLPYAEPFRLSGSDALAVNAQQSAIRQQFATVASTFRYSMAFNGGGADLTALNTCFPNALTGDPLTSVSKCLTLSFDWVNHTRDHLRMDVMDSATTDRQIGSNNTIARNLGLNRSNRALITGEHSGLGYMYPGDDGTQNDVDLPIPKVDYGLGASNPNMLNSAVKYNARYLASDHSVASHWDPSCVVCGVPHPMNSGIFLVPRWPNNIHYHVTEPAEATASYNHLYGPNGIRPYWDHDLTFSEMLDKESDIAMAHVLDGTPFPHYMHQTNLRQYASGQSLATDWVRAVLTKYNVYSKLPLENYNWNALGSYVENRTKEEKAKVAGTLTGVLDRALNTVTLYSTGGSTPATLTGTKSSGKMYGNYRIQKYTISGNLTIAVAPK